MIEPPQIGCGLAGQAQASNAQVSLDLQADAVDVAVPGVLGLRLGLRGAGTAPSGPYAADVARATGTLSDVRCWPTPGISVDVEDALVDIHLELDLEVRLPLAGWVTVPIELAADATADEVTAEINLPNEAAYDTPVSVGTGLPSLHPHLDLPLLGTVLDPVVEFVVTPLVDDLTDLVLNPLLDGLGLGINGADVYALPTPECDVPVLRQ